MSIFETKVYFVRFTTEKNNKFKHVAVELNKMNHTGFQSECMYLRNLIYR